jgi:hypothetical protein
VRCLCRGALFERWIWFFWQVGCRCDGGNCFVYIFWWLSFLFAARCRPASMLSSCCCLVIALATGRWWMFLLRWRGGGGAEKMDFSADGGMRCSAGEQGVCIICMYVCLKREGWEPMYRRKDRRMSLCSMLGQKRVLQTCLPQSNMPSVSRVTLSLLDVN